MREAAQHPAAEFVNATILLHDAEIRFHASTRTSENKQLKVGVMEWDGMGWDGVEWGEMEYGMCALRSDEHKYLPARTRVLAPVVQRFSGGRGSAARALSQKETGR